MASSPQNNFSWASLYRFYATRALFFFFFRLIRLINRFFFFPLSLSRLAGLMGLTPYYRLIPIHTAHWRKARSPLQRRRECLYMPVNHPDRFFMPLHVCLYVFCLICEVVWIPSGCCYVRHCGYLLSYMILLLVNAFFMCLHLGMTSSITIRVSAPWRQFVLIIFFILPML